MSDHTLQNDWITIIKGNLLVLYTYDQDVFVAGDLLWYPVEGDNLTRVAPDVLVAFGRPKGPRGSYRQWDEGGVVPQVVFEILSLGNRFSEMANKLNFYDRFGVEEYYLYNPFNFEFDVWLRDMGSGRLVAQDTGSGFTSPRLGVRFVPGVEAPMEMFLPDGRPFLAFEEMRQPMDEAELRADEAELRADEAEQRAEQAEQRAENEERRANAADQQIADLMAQLRALGVEPTS